MMMVDMMVGESVVLMVVWTAQQMVASSVDWLVDAKVAHWAFDLAAQ